MALTLGRYSLGVGDRFAREAEAQLDALVQAARLGVEIVPVWNKSNREHNIVGTEPASVREAACAAVRALRWKAPYFVDADHIDLGTVDRFLESSDFFTLDVAGLIGQPVPADAVREFVAAHPELIGPPGQERATRPRLSADGLARVTSRYLGAVQEAGRIYRHIEAAKGAGTFITEVSFDETDTPQTPAELLVILAALADQGVPVQTIAPRFSGRFNKGVDYVGDVARFESEFRADIAVLAYAVGRYHLPPDLKLSVHSGSDKFSIYPAIHRALGELDAGVHVKTAGTTWLEECIGLAEHGGAGLEMVKHMYAGAYAKREELAAPYASVIQIDPVRLPSPARVDSWSGPQLVAALRHDPTCPAYNPDLRQLVHIGYKMAARLGTAYLDMLAECRATVARNVTGNLFERHIRPIFLGPA